MQKKAFPFFIGVVAVLAAVVFVSTTTEVFWYAPDTEIPVPVREAEFKEIAPTDHPIRLRVPELDIDAHIQEVGVNHLGNMASPSNFTDVGWYKYGTPPGFTGSAVITGHVDNALALDGVFKRLGELTVGDDIYIEKKDGGELHFRVVEIQKYPYTRVPLKILFSRRDVPRLNLITCGGIWLPHEKSYDERLIVYTELVS